MSVFDVYSRLFIFPKYHYFGFFSKRLDIPPPHFKPKKSICGYLKRISVDFNLSTSRINDSLVSLNLSSRLLVRIVPMMVLELGVLIDSVE